MGASFELTLLGSTLAFELDTTPPQVTWGEPTGTTAGELMQIAYYSDEPIAAADLHLSDGRSLAVDILVERLEVLLLADAPAGATLTVRDDVGNSTSLSISIVPATSVKITLDTTAPTCSIDSYTGGDAGQSLSVSFSAGHSSIRTRCRLRLGDGRMVALPLVGEQMVGTIPADAPGGGATILLSAVDDVGNFSEDSLGIMVVSEAPTQPIVTTGGGWTPTIYQTSPEETRTRVRRSQKFVGRLEVASARHEEFEASCEIVRSESSEHPARLEVVASRSRSFDASLEVLDSFARLLEDDEALALLLV